MAWGQAAETPKPAAPEGQAAPITQPGSAAQVQAIAPAGASAAAPSDPNATVIPAGTKLPLVLKQAISTKNAKEGDAVYAETSFPFVVNDRVLIPAGTYVQGRSRTRCIPDDHERPGGTSHAFHFDDLSQRLYGHAAGSVENTPGDDDKGVKDKEGTIQADNDTGKRIEDAAKGAAVGGAVGGHWWLSGRGWKWGALRRAWLD